MSTIIILLFLGVLLSDRAYPAAPTMRVAQPPQQRRYNRGRTPTSMRYAMFYTLAKHL